VLYLGEWVIKDSIRVFINDSLITQDRWTFNEVRGEWALRKPVKPHLKHTVLKLHIEYAYLPLVLQRIYRARELIDADSLITANNTESDTARVQVARSTTTGTSFLNNSSLNQQGSLSRGIIVGSNQDFALESGLQFELNGQLTEDVSINASLTDRSVPIQPDGSTQNLREFDRVFIELRAPSTTLQMGDVDLSLQQSEFARINRRLQGANARVSTAAGEYKGALSVARGTFRQIAFQGQDGVQGPYRLTGDGGEEFVTVLAGSEQVYIDGQLVQRGQENEYIIDYGLGEITFTSNLFITDETRISVEYQFLDQDFTRTFAAAEGRDDNLLNGKLSVGATFIREADGDDLLSQRSLSESEIDLLASVGDDLEQAIVSSADTADVEDENQVKYALVDTTFNGQVFQIFKNIPGSPEAVFTVRFTRVEQGEGDYRRVGGTVNGLLFEWVGPGRGDYVPFRQLPAPVKQQMVAIDANLELSKNIEAFGEWAGSSFDRNRFSSLDDNDNEDLAYTAGLRLKPSQTGLGKIGVQLKRRFSGDKFTFFDRTRDIEFNRKWNVIRDQQTQEELNEGRVSWSSGEFNNAFIEYGRLERSGLESERQASSLTMGEIQDNFLQYEQDWVQSKSSALDESGNWFRNKATAGSSLEFGNIFLKPTVQFEQEDRRQRSLSTDSLKQNSFSFYEISPGLEIEIDHISASAFISYRQDRAVVDNQLARQSDAVEQRYSIAYEPTKWVSTNQVVAIRNREFTDSFDAQNATNRRGLLVRSVTNYTTPGENLEGDFFYEVNTQRKPLLQESFIEVGAELGQFVWEDNNADGVQQIEEFFPEVSANEGTFIKQFIPSDELFPTVDLSVRFRNQVQPFDLFDMNNTWLRQLIFRTRVNISESSTTQNLSDIYLLKLETFRDDSTTLNGRIFWEQEIDLFPDAEKIDLSARFNQNRALNRLSSELQNVFNEGFFISTAVRPKWKYAFTLKAQRILNKNISDRLSARNFDISSWQLEPGVELIFNRSFATFYSVGFTKKRDRFPAAPVEAEIWKVKMESRGYLWNKIQNTARIEFRSTNIDGLSSSLGQFELTEGTGEGRNLIWSLNASYKVSSLFRMSLNYDGRTVKNNPTIHTARVVVSAVF